jgi:hypothetical protein
LAGRLTELNQALNHMLDVSEYYKFGDLLVFYEESQHVVIWGFDYLCGEKSLDPTIYQTSPRQTAWKKAYVTMSDFFLSMFFWQAINGGFRYGGNLFLENAPIQLESTWRPDDLVEHGYTGGLEVFYRPQQLVCLSGEGADRMLHGAATTDQGFAELTRSLGVSWLGTWGS